MRDGSHVEVEAKPYGWLVKAVYEGGVAMWQRKAKTHKELKFHLETAARRLAKHWYDLDKLHGKA